MLRAYLWTRRRDTDFKRWMESVNRTKNVLLATAKLVCESQRNARRDLEEVVGESNDG